MPNIMGAPDRLHTHVVDADGISALDADAWDRLSAAALSENPFYARQYVLAGLTTIDAAAGVKAVCVMDERGELAGLFPFRKYDLLPLASSVAQAASNLYQFSGHPLVARERAGEVIGAWLDTIVSGKAPRIWMLPNFDLNSRLKCLIEDECADRRITTATAAPYDRPHLTGVAGGFDAHCAKVIPRKRLKDIQRNLRRLQECGELAFERATEPIKVRQRLDQFLELEAAGWKGDYGTAFLSAKEHELFARHAFSGNSEGQARCIIDSLLLDGEPIALSINISSGSVAFTPKCAYSEKWRRYSPGIVLEYLVVERFYAQSEFAEMDAATVALDHVVRDLWNARMTMGHLVIGANRRGTRALATGLAWAHRGKKVARRILRRR